MSGIEKHNYPLFFEVAQSLVRVPEGGDPDDPDNNIKVVNPAERAPAGRDYDFYMKRGFGLLLKCNTIAMLPNWDESSGATAELFLAMQCGMTTCLALNQNGRWLLREVPYKIMKRDWNEHLLCI